MGTPMGSLFKRPSNRPRPVLSTADIPLPPATPEERELTVMYSSVDHGELLGGSVEILNGLNEVFGPIEQAFKDLGAVTLDYQSHPQLKVFGLQSPGRGDHVVAAVKAAELFVTGVNSANERRGWGLKAICGVASGRAAYGWLGAPQHRKASVVGHPVRLAKRLYEESAERELSVLVCPNVREAAGSLYSFEFVTELRLTDDSDPVQVYTMA